MSTPDKPLAGAELLRRELSPEERAKIDLEIMMIAWRRKRAQIEGLPISARAKALIHALDDLRDDLWNGRPIDASAAKAIEVDARRRRREMKKAGVRYSVDWLAERSPDTLPKTLGSTSGPGAFEVAGQLFTVPPLSAERVRNIYYAKGPSKKKLPRKRKAR